MMVINEMDSLLTDWRMRNEKLADRMNNIARQFINSEGEGELIG